MDPTRSGAWRTRRNSLAPVYGRLVSRPPKKNPKPRIESQCGQEYMISFLIKPATSRSTPSGTETSADSLRVLSSVTTCLQYGHLGMLGLYQVPDQSMAPTTAH